MSEVSTIHCPPERTATHSAQLLALAARLRWISGCAILIAAGGAWLASSGLVGALWLAAGLPGLYAQALGLHLAFDRAVFADWAQRWREDASPQRVEADLAAFDAWRSRHFPKFSSAARPAAIEERAAGARRLLRRLVFIVGLQIVSVAVLAFSCVILDL